MTEPLDVAVIGVGSLGYHHARLLRDLPGVRLAGIHDILPERLAEVGQALGIPTFEDQASLLDRAEAVIVAVPTSAHEEVAVAALASGAHVLIEKPIAPTLDAADRILAAARDADRLVQIGHVERFNPVLQACEPYLDEPLFIESHRLAPFALRGTDVAVILDLMIHDLDLVLSFVKQPVARVAAVGVPVLADHPDIANARLEFEGGGVANLTASRVSLEKMRKIRFFQRSGYISLDLAAGTGEFLRLRTDAPFALGSPLPGSSLSDIVERVALEGDTVEPLQRELESFVAAIEGREPVAVSGADGRRALGVALDIIERIERHVVDTSSA